ncbi:MAG: 1-(5-phosphoribosyl)-5-[(5-phosphoribosylamino)methylideneamino]imidazole-4-carboxamide isomerase [Anaerolineae bacterium]|nr:1-(5-phosphoribosyl)-5-[(5-phosphoribosylamino)methylideneamino]imidazole-4-carboxamide isomerase [Anaerolineae bacterium]
MIIFPAIDLRGGRCVRLRQGDPGAETVFGDDPVAVARRWAAEGAAWLHIVNLDGALGDATASTLNLLALQAILRQVSVSVQFGGGLRTIDDIARALHAGVTRVVLGTAAVRDPELVDCALGRFGPERLVAAIDARGGQVAIRGWQETTPLSAIALGRQLRDMGILRIIYTDIARDGMLSGPDLAGIAALRADTGLAIVASGGIASLDDLSALRRLGSWLEGAILGRALYTGAIQLPAALALAREQPEAGHAG